MTTQQRIRTLEALATVLEWLTLGAAIAVLYWLAELGSRAAYLVDP